MTALSITLDEMLGGDPIDAIGGEIATFHAPPIPAAADFAALPDTDDRSEKAIQNDALVELWRTFMPLGCFWWRENTGTAWQGRKIKHDKDVLVLADAHPVTFGLVGIADIMGCAAGQAFAIEMKDATGKQRKAQINFERAWKKSGGVYILARTVKEAVQGVQVALSRRK